MHQCQALIRHVQGFDRVYRNGTRNCVALKSITQQIQLAQ